jgi:hypothetical protein
MERRELGPSGLHFLTLQVSVAAVTAVEPDMDQVSADFEALLWDMKNGIDENGQVALRETVRRLVSRIALRWDWRPVNKYTNTSSPAAPSTCGRKKERTSYPRRKIVYKTAFFLLPFGPEDLTG